MSPEKWDILAEHFEKALELSEEKQAAFIEDIRSQDSDMADELVSLLHHAVESKPFIENLNDVMPIVKEPSARRDITSAGGDQKNDPYQIVGTRIDRYHVLDVIGAGGMGVVYKAEDTDLHRLVALKFLPPELNRDWGARNRFITEARAASALDHPNVCAIYEVSGIRDERTFIVMGYYKGRTLDSIIKEGALSYKEAVDYTLQIARGLQAAHRAGIIHRDIKPGNIMVTDDGVVKILDFGIAKYADLELTKTGTTIGTVAYMSPDLIRGEEAKPATDIWSLGVLAYEMVSGARPFKGDRYEGIMYCVLHEEPPFDEDFPADAPPHLTAIITRCLQKDQRDRYQSAEEVIRDIEREAIHERSSGQYNVVSTSKWDIRQVVGLSVLALVLISLWPIIQFASNRGGGSEDEQRIAVMPFNAVPDGSEESQVLAEGLMYTLASTMAYLDSPEQPVSVIPVSMVRSYGVQNAEDARKMLDANLTVEGLLSKSEDAVNLVLNLVESERSRVLGGDFRQTNNPLSPEFLEEVLFRFAEILGISLDEEKRTTFNELLPDNQDAYELYLQGVGYLQRFDKPGYVDFSIDLFNESIQADSMYAPAYAGLCEALWEKYVYTFDQNYVDQARANCNKSAAIGNDLAAVLIPLGSVFLRTGQPDLAENTLRRAIELEPENPEAYRWLGRVYFNEIKLDSARANYQRAIDLRRSNWLYHYELGVLLNENGLHQEAQERFSFARRLTPDNYLPVYQLGVIQRYLSDFEESEASFLAAMEMNPDVPFVRRGLGYLYYREQQYENVIDVLMPAADMGDLVSINYLADASYWLGNQANADSLWLTAIANARAALDVDPTNRVARSVLMDALSARGQLEESATELQALSGEERNYPWVAYFSSRVLERNGERSQAITSIERAMEQHFDFYMFENDPWLVELRTDPAYITLRDQYLTD